MPRSQPQLFNFLQHETIIILITAKFELVAGNAVVALVMDFILINQVP